MLPETLVLQVREQVQAPEQLELKSSLQVATSGEERVVLSFCQDRRREVGAVNNEKLSNRMVGKLEIQNEMIHVHGYPCVNDEVTLTLT